MSNWRNTRDYRIWRAIVIRRDKVCQFCGTRLSRHAHHLESGSYFPELRFIPENGICLCSNCHLVLFHSIFMGSTRKKTTKKDYDRFIRLDSKLLDKNINTISELTASGDLKSLMISQSPTYCKN